MSFTLKIDKALRCSVSGVDYGPMTLHEVLGRHDQPRSLVCKVDGHKGWSGRGQQTYYPAHFLIFDVDKVILPGLYSVGTNPDRFDIRGGPSQRAMNLAKEIASAAVHP